MSCENMGGQYQNNCYEGQKNKAFSVRQYRQKEVQDVASPFVSLSAYTANIFSFSMIVNTIVGQSSEKKTPSLSSEEGA
jgi:hypothetical protein